MQYKKHMHTVSKSFTFCAGHCLPFHEGLCKNIHGHNYEVQVELSGELDDNGMLIDFGILKNVLVKPILDRLDHSFIVNRHLDIMLLDYLEMMGKKTFNMKDKQSTAENIAQMICEEIVFLIEGLHFTNLDGIAVTVYETPTSEGSYSLHLDNLGDDNDKNLH